MSQEPVSGISRSANPALLFVGAMIVGLLGAAVVVPERGPGLVQPAQPAMASANTGKQSAGSGPGPGPAPEQLQAMLEIYAADVLSGRYDPQLSYICASDRENFDPKRPFYAFERMYPNFRDGVQIDAFDAVVSSKDSDVVRATVRTRSVMGQSGNSFYGERLESTGYFRKESGGYTMCPSAAEAF